MVYDDLCEICGKTFDELLKEDPKNEPSWTAQTYANRNICRNCAKPFIPQIRMDSSKNHPNTCYCHSCIIAHELGYYKKNNDWVKLSNVICKFAKGCETCYHSKEHILNSHCNEVCNENRTIGCEDV